MTRGKMEPKDKIVWVQDILKSLPIFLSSCVFHGPSEAPGVLCLLSLLPELGKRAACTFSLQEVEMGMNDAE